MRTVFIKIKKIVAFVLALAFVTGTLCTLALPGGGLKEAYAENTTYWIDIYREFLEDKEYLSMGQDYGSETTIVGKFYDMDHDAIPELILDNGYSGRSVRAAYIYSCVNGEVKYLGIGPSDAYYDVDDENYSELYGYYSDSGYLSRYVKNGVNISSDLFQEYSDDDFNNDTRYGYIPKKYIFELIRELGLYKSLASEPLYMFRAPYTVLQWEKLFSQFDFCTGTSIYDPHNIDGTCPDIMRCIIMHPSLANIYGYGIESSWGRDGKKDPQGKYDSYFAIEEDFAEFVAKDIYNISDSDYDRLLSKLLEKDCYRDGGRIYSFMGGVGGPAYVNDYEAIGYDGDYFYVTYSTYLDNGDNSLDPNDRNYYKVSDERTYCLKEKTLDGKNYWSIYSIEEGGYSGDIDRPDDNGGGSSMGDDDADINGWKGFYRYDENTTITVKEVYDDRIVVVETGLTASGESCFETEKTLYFTHKSGVEAFEPFQNGSGEVLYKLKTDRITVVYPDGWWDDRDYMKVDEGTGDTGETTTGGNDTSDSGDDNTGESNTGTDDTDFSDRYAPYPVIALKSKSNGCYVTCDIGARGSDGKYAHFNEPELHLDASKIDAYEMFELVRCSDGSYALRSLANRKYLSTDSSKTIETGFSVLIHSYVYKDFVEDDCKLDLELDSKYTKVKFRNSNKYLKNNNGKLEPDADEAKAEEFEMVYLKEDYEDWEKSVLAGKEWFNIDGKGKGYWDIQNDIGNGSTEALRALGYTPMHLKGQDDKTTIENHQMQCAVGVKETNGYYDVIVTFQGTGGYSDETWELVNAAEDGAMSVLNIFNFNSFVHDGYLAMVGLFIQKKDDIVATVNGNSITYEYLLEEAKCNRAGFTLLGHSMGGAMAQIYGCCLVNMDINVELIRGRTFNSALAFTEDDEEVNFRDWYNLCVSTDTVTNGQVPGSLNVYGIHRIGKTIWLYDNEPDKNTDHSIINIAEPKHNMDKKLLEILQSIYAAGGEYKVQEFGYDGIFVTNRNDVSIYEEPVRDSAKTGGFPNRYSVVNVKGYIYNKWGNKWYCLDDGSYIYSNNVSYIEKLDLKYDDRYIYYCYKDDAPVRNGFNDDADIIARLSQNQVVELKYGVRNLNGNFWFFIGNGWVYSGNLGVYDKLNKTYKRLRFDCPVDVELYDSDENLVARISCDGTMESVDYDRITPYMVGDAKFFDISDDEEYTVRIDARFYGGMEYEICSDYDKELGDFKAKKHFNDVTLEINDSFVSKVGGDIQTDDVELKEVDDAGNTIRNIQPSEYIEERVLPPDDTGEDGDENFDNSGSGKNGVNPRNGSSPGSEDDNKSGGLLIIVFAAAAAVLIIGFAIFRGRQKRKLMRNDPAAGDAQKIARMINPETQRSEQPCRKDSPRQQFGQQQQMNTSEQSRRFETHFCAKCGAPLDPEQLYCGVCGMKRI